LHKQTKPNQNPKIKIQDRVLIVQGGYVSASQGTQLSVTKKSNVLDKPKPNILNVGSKKTPNDQNDTSNNNNNNNNNNSSTDNNDSAPPRQGLRHDPIVAPSPPEVTVSSMSFS